MPKIELAIKDAIQRGAGRQIRGATRPLRREVRRLRQTVAALRRDIASLKETATRWRRTLGDQPLTPPVTEAEAKAARLSPGLIRSVRTRLGLSQAKLARLVGVSAIAVTQWESGRSAPSGKNRGAVVGLRRLGKREARRILAEMPRPQARRVRRKVRTTTGRRKATAKRKAQARRKR